MISRAYRPAAILAAIRISCVSSEMSRDYIGSCKGCCLARDPVKSVVLPGGWTVNHYGDKDTFLGRLALQPRRHVMEFAKLRPRELKAFGPNIKRIECSLSRYFETQYDDHVDRLYVAYFFEYADEGWHLHVHLIPRFRSIAGEHFQAWEIYKARECPAFPERYRKGRDDPESDALIQHLTRQLTRTWWRRFLARLGLSKP
jgi:diadenosine tetraphosphate (Ap4A) HIT family hydrolase